MKTLTERLATELNIRLEQVNATIALIDEGATVPFIARYRKEITGGLDDTQLRTLHERLHYLRELDERRTVILQSIQAQGKLNEELTQLINAAETKTSLEDLYLPYKPKRRTKAQIAREAGLQPLAETLLSNSTHDPELIALQYFNLEKGIDTTEAALEGARQILMEQFAEEATLIGILRKYIWDNGLINSKVVPGKETEGNKFADYFAYSEAIKLIPSHRALALLRGAKEKILQLNLTLGDKDKLDPHPCEIMIAKHYHISQQNRPADQWLLETVHFAYHVKIIVHLETELMSTLREKAEEEAIKVFARNLHDLLLAAPAGEYVTMGLDPGLRTGVKVAVVNNTGKLLDHATIYPHKPKDQWEQSLTTLADLCKKHHIKLISIGNGTASRETDKLALELIKKHPELNLSKIVVSEAGASVYSASKLAANEFPNLDVSLRGAVCIARRLQDPLAELVKIEPKAIGVGQYQHDVNQIKLARSLEAVVEDCVNAVGVDVNTASVPLLTYISGLNQDIASKIVEYRNANGAFPDRQTLLQVPRLGNKVFEQSAGFLRIKNGSNPLDESGVHPEAYAVVKRILEKNKKEIKEVIGCSTFLKSLHATDYTDEHFGVPTVSDIIAELEKPGRDPRPEFKAPVFQDGIEDIKDLQVGMLLEGMVTNVTNFGAFVDIGVHQDGLVHISALTNKYINDPRSVVKTGDIVKVKVLEVDLNRKRIGLTMCLTEKIVPKKKVIEKKPKPPKKKKSVKILQPKADSAFALALASALNSKK